MHLAASLPAVINNDDIAQLERRASFSPPCKEQWHLAASVGGRALAMVRLTHGADACLLPLHCRTVTKMLHTLAPDVMQESRSIWGSSSQLFIQWESEIWTAGPITDSTAAASR